MNTKYAFSFIFGILILISGCLPGPNDSRSNPHDPESPDFIPYFEALTVSVSDNSTIVNLGWNDKSFYEDGFIIEKRYDQNSEFFPFDTTLARLYSDTTNLYSLDLQYKVSSVVQQNDGSLDKRYSLETEPINFGYLNNTSAFSNNDSVFVQWYNKSFFITQITVEYKERTSSDWIFLSALTDISDSFMRVKYDLPVNSKLDFRVKLYLKNYTGKLEEFYSQLIYYK